MRQAQLKYSKEKSIRFSGENNPSKRPEVREKISKSNLGKTHSVETRLKMSIARIGDKNPNWRGGTKHLPYTIEWNDTLRKAIRQRDNYVCQLCGKKQKRPRLHIHHIDYDKENQDPDNMVSLCKGCHAKTNYNRKLWIKLFKTKIRIVK